MARVDVEIPHRLSREEARNRIREVTPRLEQEYSALCRWDGESRLLVTRKGLKAALDIEDTCVRVGIELGFLLGPLGNSFPVPEPHPERDVILVAGGVGVAPLIFFADALQMHVGRFRVCGLYGGASDAHLPLWTEFAGRCEEFYVTTEDGSAGEEGLVTAPLPAQLTRGDAQVVYTCGPRPMMAAVAALCAEAKVPCYASLEQWMGCGVGACLGCVVPTTGPEQYQRVCQDGPVFPAEIIDWGKLSQ